MADQLIINHQQPIPLKVRSLVGLLPLIAVAVIAWLKPWRDGPAVEFVIPPPPVPSPAEVAARVYPVGVQPAASKPAPPPAAASRAQR